MRRFSWMFSMLALTAAVHGQTTCNPTNQDCTLQQTIDFYRAAVAGAVEEKVVDSNRATTPPDAFAGRVHNSYQDYLNLLSFAINDVQESSDGKAVVVRFNPKRQGTHLFGASLTANKPVVSETVKNAIPEADRDAAVAALEKQMGDTDDLTWAGSYSFATSDCTNVPATQRCWGRTPAAYRDILSRLISANAPDAAELTIAKKLHDLFPTAAGSVFDEHLSKATKRADVLDLAQQLAAGEKLAAARTDAFYAALHLDVIPKLIDNQPQISGEITYHAPSRFSGPIDRAISLELHFGDTNVNALRKACSAFSGDDLTKCYHDQLENYATNGFSPNKFVFTATRTWSGSFHLPALPSAQALSLPTITLGKTSEIHVKAQGGRDIQAALAGKTMRADLSFEGVRIDHRVVSPATPPTVNPLERTFADAAAPTAEKVNRWVGTLTLSIPLGDVITLPLSITYANKSEFLGDQKDHVGAHIGISYRLPHLFGSP